MTKGTLDVEPLLLDIPDTLESEHLTIRVPKAGDGPAVNAAIVDSLESLKPWLPWAQTTPTVEQTEANCRTARARFLLREDITLRLYLKGTDTVVGSSGLHRIDWSVPSCEIGYWIGRPFEGQGYATEAVRTIADFAISRLGMRRLQIQADDRNRRSWRVAERCGFSLEGVHRQCRRDNQKQLADMRVYARTGAGA